MRIPLRTGRYFREAIRPESEKVAIIDEYLARKYFPPGKAIGGRIRRGIEAKDGSTR